MRMGRWRVSLTGTRAIGNMNMSKDELALKLHDRATRGESLSAEEQAL